METCIISMETNIISMEIYSMVALEIYNTVSIWKVTSYTWENQGISSCRLLRETSHPLTLLQVVIITVTVCVGWTLNFLFRILILETFEIINENEVSDTAA